MSTDPITPKNTQPSLLRNWLSLTGLVVVIGSIFSFLLLVLLDTMAHFSNPYVGILTYVIAPGFLISGLVLTAIGAVRERRQLRGAGTLLPKVVIDLTRPRDRRVLGWFLLGSLAFLLLSAFGSYQTYHFSESTQFCGQTCHTVMQPELVTYSHGPHARVGCVDCHIGPGAEWFVKAKVSGTYQLYAVAFNKYPRPVPTPIKNLRPAQQTCEQCHWPQKFVGNLERTYNYFLGDETNTPYTLSLLMKVGGGDPTHGPTGGIHWHMNVGNKVEYIATDEARQTIPWVRITDAQGVVTVFRTKSFTNAPTPQTLRQMDCMDCHNRPAHSYEAPDASVNLQMSLGRINPGLPWIKTNALWALTRSYTNETQALQGIATFLVGKYPTDPRIRPAIDAVQQIYRNNFFPEMKANWRVYPNNIGHKDWPGCFRCHDGKHLAEDGKRAIKANDCNACHTILAQGSGADLLKMTPVGQEFKHPGGDYDPSCIDCHTGGP
jgi:nitrate/TMAO reductase-like tetraheme cytochrome c subunit